MSNPSAVTDKAGRMRSLEWVDVSAMRVSPLAQRDLRPGWADRIASEFDPEEFGTLTVNFRDGYFWVIDGLHRREALKILGLADCKVECWVYRGLSEQQEAYKFLVLNNRLQVAQFPRFRIAVEAGSSEEVAINAIVQDAGLRVSLDKREGSINCVGTLRRVYRRDGGEVLRRALSITRDAYGTPGLRSAVVDGLSLFVARHAQKLKDERAVEKLAAAHGGVNGLLGRAEKLYQRLGGRRNHCVAAAAVSIYNAGKQGGSLPNWWRGAPE